MLLYTASTLLLLSQGKINRQELSLLDRYTCYYTLGSQLPFVQCTPCYYSNSSDGYR